MVNMPHLFARRWLKARSVDKGRRSHRKTRNKKSGVVGQDGWRHGQKKGRDAF